jgi:hypothetical protein
MEAGMKILVVTTWGKEYDELCSIISPANLEYCRRHGYEYNIHHCSFNNSSIYYNVHLNLVKEMFKYYDLIISLDSDVLIMDHRKKYEEIFDWDFDQMIGDEYLGPGSSPINAGVVLWKKCTTSRLLIENLLENREEGEKDPRVWQQQIAVMMSQGNILTNRMKIVSAHEINSWAGVGKSPSYKPGDFAIHFYCLEYQKKIQLAKKYVREITR